MYSADGLNMGGALDIPGHRGWPRPPQNFLSPQEFCVEYWAACDGGSNM